MSPGVIGEAKAGKKGLPRGWAEVGKGCVVGAREALWL